MSSLLTKHGQPSTYSPRTLETSRNRLGRFLSSITHIGSPLATPGGGNSVDFPESPLKARIYRRGGQIEAEELGSGVSGLRRKEGVQGKVNFGLSDGATVREGRLSILDLPDDLILLIIEHLPQSAQLFHIVSLVSRRFFNLAQSPTLWAELYRSTPGYGLSDDAIRHGIAVAVPPKLAENWYHLDRSWPNASSHIPSSPVRTPANASDSSSLSIHSSSMQIPIHFPSLYRARHTLSLAIRRPSVTHRTHTQTLAQHADSVYCVKIVGHWIFTGSRDRSIRIWRVGDYDERGLLGETKLVKTVSDAHAGSVLCMSIELDDDGGTMVTGSSDQKAKVWRIAFPPAENGFIAEPNVWLEATLSDHTSGILDVILSEKHIVSCSKDAKIRVYDRSTLKLKSVINAHTQSVNSLAINPERTRLASASGDGSWRIWNLADGLDESSASPGGADGDQGLACIAWQGDYIAVGDNGRNVSVYQASSGKLLRTCRGHTDLVRSVAIDADEGLVVSGSYDGSVRIWDLHTGILIRIISTSKTLMFDVHLSFNKLLVAKQDNTIEIISLVTGLPYLNIML